MKGLCALSQLNVCYLLSAFQTEVTSVCRALCFKPAGFIFSIRKHGSMSRNPGGGENRCCKFFVSISKDGRIKGDVFFILSA